MQTFDLSRFHKAQEGDYCIALEEIKNGRKRSHWMWYIFPQLKGLGHSWAADYYGLDGIGEAKAFLDDPLLKSHLLEISSVLLTLENNDARHVMGYPDDLKLRSCMTLFTAANPTESVFQSVLDKFFAGEPDPITLRLLNEEKTK